MDDEGDEIKVTVEWAHIDDRLIKILLVFNNTYWCFEICQDGNDENIWRMALNGNSRLFVIEKEEDIFKVGQRVFIDFGSAKQYIRQTTVQMLSSAWNYCDEMYQKEKWEEADGGLVKTFDNETFLAIVDYEKDCSLFFGNKCLKNYPTREIAVQDAQKQYIYTVVPILMELHIANHTDTDFYEQ